MIDARSNVGTRINQLHGALKWLRAEYKENLTLVVAPAGFFGYENKLPVWTQTDDVHVVEAKGETVETTVGRVLFYSVVPQEIPFQYVNRPMSKKALGELIDRCYLY